MIVCASVLVLLSVVTASASVRDELSFDALLCEWQVCEDARPIMSATTTPTLNWALSTHANGGISSNQTGYQVRVWDTTNDCGKGNTTVLDTGKLSGSHQGYTVPSGHLQPGHSYAWSVRVNTTDLASTWSSPCRLFLPSFGTPTPIWAPSPLVYGSNPAAGNAAVPGFVYFKAELELPPAETVTNAVLLVTAVGPYSTLGGDQKLLAAYKLFLCGKLVGGGPGRPRCGPLPCIGREVEQVFDGFDVTNLIRDCPNSSSVPVFVSSYGKSQPPHVQPGLALKLQVTTSKCDSTISSQHTLNTDVNAWSVYNADAAYNVTGSCGGGSWFYQPIENLMAPVISKVLLPTDPLQPLLDASAIQTSDSSAWTKPVARSPFKNLNPKTTPPINIFTLGPDDVRNITLIGPGHYFFELSREVMAGIDLSVQLSQDYLSQLPIGTNPTVLVRLGEELKSDGTVLSPMRTGNLYENTWTLINTTAAQRLQHHEYMEFRYGELVFGPRPPATCGVIAEGGVARVGCPAGFLLSQPVFASYGTPSGSCLPDGTNTFKQNSTCDSPHSREVFIKACTGKQACKVPVENDEFGGDPCDRTPKKLAFQFQCVSTTGVTANPSIGTFNISAQVVQMRYLKNHSAMMKTSDPVLNDVWEMCRYTVEATTLDVFADSNTRQRSSDCLADDVTTAESIFATTLQFTIQKYHAHRIIASGPASRVDWSVLAIVLVQRYVLFSGDTSLGVEYFDVLMSNFSKIDLIDSKTGLVTNAIPLVDWPKGMQDRWVSSEVNSIASAWVYYGMQSLASLAGYINKTDTAKSLLEKASQLKVAANKAFWNGTAFCDGVCSKIPHTAFHSTVYALAFDFVSAENVEAAWRYARGRINPPFNLSVSTAWPPPGPSSGLGMPCGAYVSQFAIEAMYARQADKGLSAVQVMRSNATNSWVAMLKQGATTTMEMWNADEKPNLTFSHPWASSPAFLVAWYLFGIQALAPAWEQIAITPSVGDLTSGSYSLPTIRGTISISFGQWLQCPANKSTCERFSLSVTLPIGMQARVRMPLPSKECNLHLNGKQCAFENSDSGYSSVIMVQSGVHHLSVSDC